MSLKYTVIEIFCNEEAQYQRKPLHEAVIDYIRGLKIAARCIVLKGTEGCYENGEVVTPTIMELSYKMPLKIEILLPSAEREAVLSTLREIVTEGVVTLRELDLYSFRTRSSLLPRQINVRDVMTPSPATVNPSTPLKKIVQLLSYSHFYGIPVVDETNHPVGIVTEIDLMQRGQLPMRVGLLSNVDWEHVDPALDSVAHKTAADLMSQPVVSIGMDEAVTKAVDQMLAKGLKRLPVVDSSGKLVGILSRWDIFRAITEVIPDWQSMKQHEVVVGDLRYVSDIMRRDTQTVSPDASIEDIIRTIDVNDIQRVAVIDPSGRYLGLISDRDLFAVFSEHDPALWQRFARKILFTGKGERHKLVGTELRGKTAAEVMRTDIPTIQERASLDEAIKIMAEKGRKRLPVVDENGKFRGMINRNALLRTGFGEQPQS